MSVCEKCWEPVDPDDLASVLVCERTHDSPAEYEEWCGYCRGIGVEYDFDYDAAWSRHLANHPDAEDCS